LIGTGSNDIVTAVSVAPYGTAYATGKATVTLTNTGSVALSGEGSPIVASSTYPGEFTEPNTTCGTSLAVGASCQITVAFAPTTATASANGNSNSYSQTLYAFFNNNYEATATLTGTGIAAGPASAPRQRQTRFRSTYLRRISMALLEAWPRSMQP
jgi:hypothetical protein